MNEEDSENYSENDEDFTDEEEDSEDEENEALADFDLQEEYKMVSLAEVISFSWHVVTTSMCGNWSRSEECATILIARCPRFLYFRLC